MKEQLTKEVEAFETGHGLSWNSWKENGIEVNGKEAFIADLSRRFELVNGSYRDRKKGHRVDIQTEISTLIQLKTTAQNGKHSDQRPYIRNKDLFARYVNPWKSRDAATVSRHATEMRKHLNEHFESEKIHFIDGSSKERLIDLWSKNFLVTDGEDGPVYHKVANGIISPQPRTFSQLFSELGASRFVDRLKTDLERKIYEAKIRSEAETIVGSPSEAKGKDHGRITREVDSVIQQLKQAQKVKVNRKLDVKPQIMSGANNPDAKTYGGISLGINIQDEFKKQFFIESGLNDESLTISDERKVDVSIRHRLDQLNSIEAIVQEASTIQLPEPQSWEF